MLMEILLGCLLLVCVYAAHWRWTLTLHTRRSFAHLPTYPQLPLIGSAHFLLGDERQMFLRFKEITEISEKRELPVVAWIGLYPCLFLSNLEDIKAVTNKFVEKPYYYHFFRQLLGDGVFSAPVGLWKLNIKKIGRIITGSVVDGFQDVFNSQAQKLVQTLKTEVTQGHFDVKNQYLSYLAVEAICHTTFGVPNTSDNAVTNEYDAGLTKIIALVHTRLTNILLHSDFLFGLSTFKTEMTEAVNKLHSTSENIIKKRQKERKGSNELHDNNLEDTKNNFISYLDILLELNSKDPTFTMKQVKNAIDTLILAGHGTTTLNLYFTLLMIGSHADVQDKLYAEMKTIFGDSTRKVQKEDLARMTYCEAVINESLRLYPPIPVVMRVADDDLKLKSCTIPKGTNCFINIFGAGRSNKYWGADAAEFRPERFESDSAANMVAAFSTGRRACIGKKYAMSIMKTFIAYCVRELVFISEVDKIELKIDVLLRTVSDDLLQVRLRED